jgi:hypothetical protein
VQLIILGVNYLKKSILDLVENSLDKVDVCRDNDWEILGERLRAGILESPEFAGEFTELQKQIIVSVCRETFYAASLIARAHAFSSIAETIRAAELESVR